MDHEDFLFQVSWNIYKARHATGLHQSQVAEKAGVSTNTYARLERRAGANTTIITLARIAEALGVEPKTLLEKHQ